MMRQATHNLFAISTTAGSRLSIKAPQICKLGQSHVLRRSLFSSTYGNGSNTKVKKGKVSPMLTVPKHIGYPEYALNGRPGESGDGVHLYQAEDIPKLRKAARLARKVLEFSLAVAKPGMTTDDIDKLAHEEMIKHGAYPSPLNYFGFPKSICTSVNEVVCHGIPDSRVLEDGDILSIDVSLYLNGVHGDNCGTVVVGKQDPKLTHLIQTTKDCVSKAIDICKPGVCITEIGKTIEEHANANDYRVIYEFCGHGTGKLLHMKPLILHYENDEEFTMKPGMVFTIEPILVQGDSDMYVWSDRWTAATKDGGWAAQIEHEVLITEDGVEVLTVLE